MLPPPSEDTAPTLGDKSAVKHAPTLMQSRGIKPYRSRSAQNLTINKHVFLKFLTKRRQNTCVKTAFTSSTRCGPVFLKPWSAESRGSSKQSQMTRLLCNALTLREQLIPRVTGLTFRGTANWLKETKNHRSSSTLVTNPPLNCEPSSTRPAATLGLGHSSNASQLSFQS